MNTLGFSVGQIFPSNDTEVTCSTVDELGGGKFRVSKEISLLGGMSRVDVKIFGFIYFNGHVCALIDKETYNGTNHWVVPVTELRRVRGETKYQTPTSPKIIGYKLKLHLSKVKEDIDRTIRQSDDTISSITTSQFFKENGWYKVYGYETNTEILKRLGLLDLWFEPVYEETKKTFIVVSGREITIAKDRIGTDNTEIPIDILETIINGGKYSIPNSNHVIEMLEATYKIGCVTLTFTDCKKIHEIYQSLQ